MTFSLGPVINLKNYKVLIDTMKKKLKKCEGNNSKLSSRNLTLNQWKIIQNKTKMKLDLNFS
jgi:hypothetical protein